MPYRMTDGTFELWIAEYHVPRLRNILLRVPDGMSPAVKVQQLIRQQKLPHQPREVRQATGQEVSEYFSRHPEKIESNTDPRFQGSGKPSTTAAPTAAKPTKRITSK